MDSNLVMSYYRRRLDKTRFDVSRDIEVPALIKMIGTVRDKTILDIGCGFGDHALILSRKNPKKIIGFDLNKELIELAKSFKIENSDFFVADMNKKFKFKSDSFDIVFSALSMHYAKDVDKFFLEVKRVLKKGGVFVFSTGHPIFNLINQSKNHLIGVKKNRDKNLIYGDYFDESFKATEYKGFGKYIHHNFTFETLIKSGLKNGFELVDYKDAKPIANSKKIDAEKYHRACSLPTIILFKFKKK